MTVEGPEDWDTEEMLNNTNVHPKPLCILTISRQPYLSLTKEAASALNNSKE
jgi:hypothetical protein